MSDPVVLGEVLGVSSSSWSDSSKLARAAKAGLLSKSFGRPSMNSGIESVSSAMSLVIFVSTRFFVFVVVVVRERGDDVTKGPTLFFGSIFSAPHFAKKME